MQHPEAHASSRLRYTEGSQDEKIETDDEEGQNDHERELLSL